MFCNTYQMSILSTILVIFKSFAIQFLCIQLFAKGLNTLPYFTQLPYHPSFRVLFKILKSRIISMHLVSFQNNSIFYISYFKCIGPGVFRIERIKYRHDVVILEKCDIVFKLLASNCIGLRTYF